MALNVFVMIPFERARDGSLNGYRIGKYPDKPLRGLEAYRNPRGFVEMTAENTPISPHFRLGQFKCKQDGGPPRYVVLEERLLLKLERVLAEVNSHGYASDTLHVMSGYRTPAYNAAIRNVKYSRHQWGEGGAGRGGLARYPATSTHGPFVHLDLRGYRARWGNRMGNQ
jgi:hypothetical protein